jgi:adenine-specific DNA-methyltransferase
MTELIWDGKYKDGKRVAPVRIALPFQTVESVNESAQVRAHQYDLWSQGRPTEWRNRLIWGDKKYVLPSLLPEFAGKVNLIYIDPPFATGADFSFMTTIPDTEESFTKEPSMIEQKAYRDTWGRGLDSYLQWFYETVVLLRQLLATNGSLYVHLDPGMSHYAKCILDEAFGIENFRNEITWKRSASKGLMTRRLARNHDVILSYQVSDQVAWNTDAVFISYDNGELDDKTTDQYRYHDKDGRLYQLTSLLNPNSDCSGRTVIERASDTRNGHG